VIPTARVYPTRVATGIAQRNRPWAWPPAGDHTPAASACGKGPDGPQRRDRRPLPDLPREWLDRGRRPSLSLPSWRVPR
jgi:hypothetical protein